MQNVYDALRPNVLWNGERPAVWTGDVSWTCAQAWDHGPRLPVFQAGRKVVTFGVAVFGVECLPLRWSAAAWLSQLAHKRKD